jgi:hypothetical protein
VHLHPLGWVNANSLPFPIVGDATDHVAVTAFFRWGSQGEREAELGLTASHELMEDRHYGRVSLERIAPAQKVARLLNAITSLETACERSTARSGGSPARLACSSRERNGVPATRST